MSDTTSETFKIMSNMQPQYADSTGRPIKVGDRVQFRGSQFTIAEFLLDQQHLDRCGIAGIRFTEQPDTDEIPDEWSVDLCR